MMGQEFRTSWFAFWLLATPIALAYVSIAYSLYLRRRHLADMIEALKNSRYIYVWGPGLRKQNWYWDLILIARIAGMMAWPKVYIRIGDLDPGDNENFPRVLRRLLIIDLIMVFVSLIWVVVVVVLLK